MAQTGAEEVEKTVVTGKRLQSGYLAEQAAVGPGFPGDAARVPQSVQVATRRLMEDLKPTTFSAIVSGAGRTSSTRNGSAPQTHETLYDWLWDLTR